MASKVNQECLALGACQCVIRCLAYGWSKCICSSKWSRDSWPHSKDYDDAQIELAKRLRYIDRIVDKWVCEFNLAHARSVKQFREWIWYIMDLRRSAELEWAQRTMHRGPAVRWMGLQGVNLECPRDIRGNLRFSGSSAGIPDGKDSLDLYAIKYYDCEPPVYNAQSARASIEHGVRTVVHPGGPGYPWMMKDGWIQKPESSQK